MGLLLKSATCKDRRFLIFSGMSGMSETNKIMLKFNSHMSDVYVFLKRILFTGHKNLFSSLFQTIALL